MFDYVEKLYNLASGHPFAAVKMVFLNILLCVSIFVFSFIVSVCDTLLADVNV